MERESEDQSTKFLESDSSAVRSPRLLPFLRQLSIAIGVWTLYFLDGVIMGVPTVVVPQLIRELNGTSNFNEDLTPWLYSVLGIGGIPWVFITPLLLEYVGRKLTLLVIAIATFIGYLVFYFSTTTVQLLISEIILSVLETGTPTVMAIMLTEYIDPKYRGVFLTIKSASFLWGIWVANGIGTYSHWKNIGILAFVCCAYTMSIPFWPESPYWLATKGKFKECASAHRWLKGTSSESEKELARLIENQKMKLNKITTKNKYSLTT